MSQDGTPGSITLEHLVSTRSVSASRLINDLSVFENRNSRRKTYSFFEISQFDSHAKTKIWRDKSLLHIVCMSTGCVEELSFCQAEGRNVCHSASCCSARPVVRNIYSFRDRDVPANLQQIIGQHPYMMTSSMISTLMSCLVSRQYT